MKARDLPGASAACLGRITLERIEKRDACLALAHTIAVEVRSIDTLLREGGQAGAVGHHRGAAGVEGGYGVIAGVNRRADIAAGVGKCKCLEPHLVPRKRRDARGKIHVQGQCVTCLGRRGDFLPKARFCLPDLPWFEKPVEGTVETRYRDLINRLRGIYTIPVNDGAGLLNGKDTYSAEPFFVPPINREAADAIEELMDRVGEGE